MSGAEIHVSIYTGNYLTGLNDKEIDGRINSLISVAQKNDWGGDHSNISVKRDPRSPKKDHLLLELSIN